MVSVAKLTHIDMGGTLLVADVMAAVWLELMTDDDLVVRVIKLTRIDVGGAFLLQTSGPQCGQYHGWL